MHSWSCTASSVKIHNEEGAVFEMMLFGTARGSEQAFPGSESDVRSILGQNLRPLSLQQRHKLDLRAI
jgi:hypothetical protein